MGKANEIVSGAALLVRRAEKVAETVAPAFEETAANTLLSKHGLFPNASLLDLRKAVARDQRIIEHPNWPKFFGEDPPAPRIITEEDIANDPVASARYKAWVGPDKEPVFSQANALERPNVQKFLAPEPYNREFNRAVKRSALPIENGSASEFSNSLPLQKNQTFQPLVDRDGPTLSLSTTNQREEGVAGLFSSRPSTYNPTPPANTSPLGPFENPTSSASVSVPNMVTKGQTIDPNINIKDGSIPKKNTAKTVYTDAENEEWMKAMGFRDSVPSKTSASTPVGNSNSADMMQLGIGGGIGFVSGYMSTGSFGGALLGAAVGAGGSHYGWRGDGSNLKKMGASSADQVKGIQSGLYGLGGGLASGLAIGIGRKIASTTNQQNEGRGRY